MIQMTDNPKYMNIQFFVNKITKTEHTQIFISVSVWICGTGKLSKTSSQRKKIA